MFPLAKETGFINPSVGQENLNGIRFALALPDGSYPVRGTVLLLVSYRIFDKKIPKLEPGWAFK